MTFAQMHAARLVTRSSPVQEFDYGWQPNSWNGNRLSK